MLGYLQACAHLIHDDNTLGALIYLHAGVFDEKVFGGLDWVLTEAGKRGLRVMLTLVNYWSAYGGMAQYVK